MPDLQWMLNVDGEVSRPHFMKQGTWRPLTLGIRIYTSFVPCFYHFLHSPEFTPDFLITMLIDSAFDDILQLPDVTGPIVTQ